MIESQVAPAGEPLELVEELFCRAENRAIAAADWYLSDRRSKRLASQLVRGSGVVLTTLAAVLPVISPLINFATLPVAYICLAAAAGGAAFDRVFGLSTAWMRDMIASQELQAHLARFRGDWCLLKVQAADPETLLRVIVAFEEGTSGILRNETLDWRREFLSSLKDLHQRASLEGGRASERSPSRVDPAKATGESR